MSASGVSPGREADAALEALLEAVTRQSERLDALADAVGELAERRRLDDPAPAAVIPGLPEPASHSRDEYAELVAEARELVAELAPPGAVVAVVSKGDPGLLQLEGRTGWHFPRTEEGQYAGAHPADSHDAIEQLEQLRSQGAEFLFFPETSAWWLDHYTGLRDHLHRRHRLLARRAGTGVLFRLQGEAHPPPAATGDEDAARAQHYEEVVAHLHHFLASLLPAGASVLVLSKGDDRLVEIEGLDAVHFPRGQDGHYVGRHPGDSREAIAWLEDERRRGAEFLVIPDTGLWWLDYYDGLREHLEHECRLVAGRSALGKVFEVALPAPAGGPRRRYWRRRSDS
jgi:hypothetical protein